MKQIKAWGISQTGLPFELDVSGALERMGWAPWQRQQKERVPLGFCFQLWKGAETQHTPIEQQLLAACKALLQVEPLTKEQHHEKNFPSYPGVDWDYVPLTHLCHGLTPPLRLSGMPIHSKKLQMLLGHIEYVDLPEALIPIPVVTPAAYKWEWGKFQLMPSIQLPSRK